MNADKCKCQEHGEKICLENPQHTPTPWDYRKEDGEGFIVNPVTGFPIAKVQGQGLTNSVNVAFMVRAVNNHQFLLDSLKEIGLQLKRGSSTIAIQKTVREAIAKAEVSHGA